MLMHALCRNNSIRVAIILGGFAFLAFVGTTGAQDASGRTAPACGPANAHFKIKLSKDHPAVAQPEPGKAMVYFIQVGGPPGFHQHYTIGIGMDGAWVGAYEHDSFFAVPVAPGKHHVCAEVHAFVWKGSNLALVHFTAEAGKAYFFRTQFLARPTSDLLDLERVDSDLSGYLIPSLPMSLLQPNK